MWHATLDRHSAGAYYHARHAHVQGKHVLHAYTPATEPYSLWEGLDRNSSEYKKLKEERSQVG